jgi:hypothetical protein
VRIEKPPQYYAIAWSEGVFIEQWIDYDLVDIKHTSDPRLERVLRDGTPTRLVHL